MKECCQPGGGGGGGSIPQPPDHQLEEQPTEPLRPGLSLLFLRSSLPIWLFLAVESSSLFHLFISLIFMFSETLH